MCWCPVAMALWLKLRLHTQVKDILQKMEKCYDSLAQHLSQATVAPESVSESLVHFNTCTSSKQPYKITQVILFARVTTVFTIQLIPLAIWGHPVKLSSPSLWFAQSWTCPWVQWCSVQSHLVSKRYVLLTRSNQTIYTTSLKMMSVLYLGPHLKASPRSGPSKLEGLAHRLEVTPVPKWNRTSPTRVMLLLRVRLGPKSLRPEDPKLLRFLAWSKMIFGRIFGRGRVVLTRLPIGDQSPYHNTCGVLQPWQSCDHRIC